MIAINLVATAEQHLHSWLMQGNISTFSPHSFHFSLLWTARVGRLLSALTDRYSKWELEENKSDWSSGSATERWKQSESTGPPAALEALVQQISQPFFTEIFILICWSVWKTSPNNFIFSRMKTPLLKGLRSISHMNLSLVIVQRAKRKYFPKIVQLV